MKKCSTCGAEKGGDAFYAGRAVCKRCISEAYFANPERRAALIEARRAERERNPFKEDAYKAANKDRIRAYLAHRAARLRGAGSEVVLISVLFARDRGVCGICQKPVAKQPLDRMMRPSHDHIIPISRGGPNTYENSRLTHLRCNVRRGNRGIG